MSERKIKISPSILAADFAHLSAEIQAIEDVSDHLHLDIMDGHFVPNLTMGPAMVRCIRPFTSLVFEAHLMVTNPQDFIEPFVEAGADLLITHVEVDQVQVCIDIIKRREKKIGLALNPETSVERVLPYLNQLDQVLVMTVSPGFGGQVFRQEPVNKIKFLRAYIDQNNLKTEIAVDGGINEKTAPIVRRAGADVLVAGSSIFSKSRDQYKTVIKTLIGHT